MQLFRKDCMGIFYAHVKRKLFNKKTALIMKLTALFLLAVCMQISAKSYSQSLHFSGKNVPLEKVFEAIKAQTGYLVFYNEEDLKNAKPVTLDASNQPLEQVLASCLKGQGLTWILQNKTIIISRTAPIMQVYDMPPPVDTGRTVFGKVTDSKGNPLAGASINVFVKKAGIALTVANARGEFTAKLTNSSWDQLVINYIGYKQQVIRLSSANYYTIQLEPDQIKLNEVTVNTGMFLRNKESFTGAASTYTGEQLKQIGNKNILQSLKTLDPSFIIVENNRTGSNPNALPTLELRGKTSINTTYLNDQFSDDPNQPLFILDGFETSLQTIYDLDMNRVETITLLKDAASTALYGSRAANGVVVVVTKRPQAGELRVNYSGDFSVDMPDLTSYNLMNSSEKLEFERLAGVYRDVNFQWEQDERYFKRLADIARGVNTYWLNEPVRTGFSNRHSIQLAGGNDGLLFSAGVNYRNEAGIMKGSKREAWGGNFSMTYRKNALHITNMFNVSGSKGTESPYGSFSEFANASPYYRKQNPDGSLPKYLDSSRLIINPLFNASLFSIDQTKSLLVSDNLQAVWTVSNEFRVTGGFMISHNNSTGTQFANPQNPMFDGVDIYQKGRYANARIESFTYSGNIMASYAKVIDKHQFNGNVRAEMGQSTSRGLGFSVVGFPYGTNGNPAFAYGFTPYSRPTSSVANNRSASFLGSLNYAYDQRFLLDATYRLDGSSVFGSNRLFKSFASGGIGWNLHKEPFMQDLRWINLLKIRGDVGLTGNTNLGQFVSTTIYTYQAGLNHFGQMLDMSSLGNPDLEWQNTLQESYGVDFAFFKSRITGSVEYFKKVTDPLVISASSALPSSTAASDNYMINAGRLTTKGWNLNVRVSPVYNLQERIIWTIGLSGAAQKSIYGDFSSKLDVLNKQQLTSKGLLRYTDGYSPDDMWTVISKGIDPANGRELFQAKDGTISNIYNTDDIVKVGNTRPVAEGVISTNFTYKSFNLGANMRYRIGGYVFNSAVYNKVENITELENNQDRRALYDRWQKPGDITQFKSITNGTFINSAPMSSRFIQKDTHFVGESFTLGWRVNSGWIRMLRMQQLSMNFYMNDIFRLESIQSERGIDYPFARSCSFSINASF